jgi:multidrug efflux system outer membrane protein
LALTLAFEQYQRGLVTYTTVLESQRRAFDAQSTVIDLRNQLLQNRITLFLALGGDFGSS